jgi:hypothetical protein
LTGADDGILAGAAGQRPVAGKAATGVSTDDRPIPLLPEDLAILRLESATIAGHTCKIVQLAAGGPDLDALRRRIDARLPDAPMLMRRLGGTAAAPSWVPDPAFDVTRHVVSVPVPVPVDRHGLLALVADLFEQRLDRSRPLWRIDQVALAGGGSVSITRSLTAPRPRGWGRCCCGTNARMYSRPPRARHPRWTIGVAALI